MTFPVVAVESGTNFAANVTTHVLNIPAGIVAGELLLILFNKDGSGTASVTTPASGWNTLIDVTGSGSVNRLYGFYRIATGSEGSTITVTTGSERTAYVSFKIAGWHGVTLPEFAPQTGSSPNPPLLTLAGWGAEDTLWIACSAIDGPVTYTGYPATYPDNRIAHSSGSSETAPISVATRNLNAASDDPGAFSINTARNGATVTIAVRPGSSGLGSSYVPRAGVASFDGMISV